jgi:serine/threonine-protein kinase
MVYLAIEMLEGLTLRALVERYGPLDEARVAYFMRQACHSLVEAHEGGVVHRDLKPDNLLVSKAGRDLDFLKVIDFGLVKELASGPSKRRLTGPLGGAELTALGARPGTPGYMAPEQIGGSPADQRADIYALACVAYFALTGQQVFVGSDSSQLMFAHLEGDAQAPSARLGRPLHAGLEELVMRCLAKNPLKRPQSMLELDEALAELRFEPPWTPARARRWWAERGGFPE